MKRVGDDAREQVEVERFEMIVAQMKRAKLHERTEHAHVQLAQLIGSQIQFSQTYEAIEQVTIALNGVELLQLIELEIELFKTTKTVERTRMRQTRKTVGAQVERLETREPLERQRLNELDSIVG